MEKRRYDLDWLRVLATLSVFLFHNIRPFDHFSFAVKNSEISLAMTMFNAWISQWMMPVFFLISGAGVYFSLKHRSSGKFIIERFKRILFPYLTIGVFVLVAIEKYVGHVLVKHEIQGTVFDAYYYYIRHLKLFDIHFPFFALPSAHLWYLKFLFVFCILTLPLFLFFQTQTGQKFISRLAGLAEVPYLIFGFCLPCILLCIVLNPDTPIGDFRDMGGWSLFVYLIYLIYGYLLFTDQRFENAIEHHGKMAFILAIAIMPLFIYMVGLLIEGQLKYGTFGYAIVMGLRTFNSWCWILAIFYLGNKYLRFSSGFLKYSNQGSIAFYILHQTVIVVVAYFICQWTVPIFLKYLIQTLISFAIIMLTYELLIRRLKFIRLLFGLKF